MPVSALPSAYGIGDFGQSARTLIDRIAAWGMQMWQILPLNPLGYGNSPYQPYSSFAGDEIYIDPDTLYREGLLTAKPDEFRRNAGTVDYPEVRVYKEKILKQAFAAFRPDQEYETFVSQEWVRLYAVFLTLKKHNQMKCWNEWPEEQKNWIKDRTFDISIYEEEIRYELFCQYEFAKQWLQLKAYANGKGIRIVGDMPFYVGIDSLDVWMNQDEFLLGADGKPTFIAGVPPDYFSADGQRWGNPIYDWKHMEENGFAFWKQRFGYNAGLFDILRIDHFRAFDTYWKIPAECKTAVTGEWIEAPGYALFDALLAEFPQAQIVAEDLGDLRPEVYVLRDHYHFPGMKIIQFVFDPLEHNMKKTERENMYVYTGTHDNETITSWLSNQPEPVQKAVVREFYALGYEEATQTKNFLRYTLDDLAAHAVLPVQDLLGLGKEGRINTPGTLGSPNWEWRMTDFAGLDAIDEWIRTAVQKSGRTYHGDVPGEGNGVVPVRSRSAARMLEIYVRQNDGKDLEACSREELFRALRLTEEDFEKEVFSPEQRRNAQKHLQKSLSGKRLLRQLAALGIYHEIEQRCTRAGFSMQEIGEERCSFRRKHRVHAGI